ncbi:phage major capsid protein [Streptomyces sp. NPDC049555]|uniref:phage major capsid protein n=1 Tax=Streptomyces sp. NPDC049555 TaxID=3154930 RepID=UPI003434697E
MKTSISGASPAFLPDDFGNLITRPLAQASIALDVTTTVHSDAHRFNFPVVTSDPNAAWVNEGEAIPTTDPGLASMTVIKAKVGAMTSISREMVLASDPAAAAIVRDGLIRNIAQTIDKAFFGNEPAPAPSGLEAVDKVTRLSAGTAWANLDPFAAAQYNAEAHNSTVTAFVTNPADALALSQLKDEKDSNRPLLGIDPTMPGRRQILGVPLRTSPAVTPGTVWAVPGEMVYAILGANSQIDTSEDRYFEQDMIAVRAITDIGFGFVYPEAIGKITLGK